MKIALLGDIGLFGNFSIATNPDAVSNLKNLTDYLERFDYVIGNLETPFTARKKPSGAKSAYLGSDPINIAMVKALNLDAVSLANNHMADFGKEGLQTTKRLLKENGVAWYGLDGRDFRIEHQDNRLLFTGYCCYTSNPIGMSRGEGKRGINRFNVSEIAGKVAQSSKEGWLNIVTVHSGIEHVHRPSVDQVKASRLIAECAPYVWYGHHPHVVQGIDCYKGSILAHSLGNFIFSEHEGDRLCPKSELTEDNRTGMILELEINNNKITGFNAILTRINENGTISFLADHSPIEKWSSMIGEALTNPRAYTEKRNEEWMRFRSKRLKMRNVKWYLKRLNLRYARLTFNYRANSRKYAKNVARHLK